MDAPLKAQEPRALVVKLSSLGDLFHALPAVHLVKNGLGVRVDWVTQPAYVDLVRCFTDVERIIPFPRHHFLRGAGSFFRELRSCSYNYVIDFQGLFKSALVSISARGRKRIGPSFSREGARMFYHAVAGPPGRDRHAVTEALDVVGYLGLDKEPIVFPVSFPKTPREEPGPRIALVPCSRWSAKNWPPDHFIRMGRDLIEAVHGSLFVLGAPADADACNAIATGVGPAAVNLCGQTSLVGMGSVLQEMDLVITVDSGPMHVAAALGIPVLAIFGATNPIRTGPFGPRHQVIMAEELRENPNLPRIYKHGKYAGQWKVAPEEVLERALVMLPSP